MRKIFFIGFFCALLAGTVFAQKSKPWNEWSKKDADKILNDSAWGQSQTKGETPVIITKSQRETQSTQANTPTDSGSTEVIFRVRFITARPIREAFGRKLVLAQPEPTKDLQDQVQAFIDRDVGDLIVIGVDVNGQDPHRTGAILQALARMTTATLNGKVYLERKDGKRLSLADYKVPINDNMGGKFFFTRTLDGQPFLTSGSDAVRFVLNLTDDMKLDAKFKISAMVYGGKLEY